MGWFKRNAGKIISVLGTAAIAGYYFFNPLATFTALSEGLGYVFSKPGMVTTGVGSTIIGTGILYDRKKSKVKRAEGVDYLKKHSRSGSVKLKKRHFDYVTLETSTGNNILKPSKGVLNKTSTGEYFFQPTTQFRGKIKGNAIKLSDVSVDFPVKHSNSKNNSLDDTINLEERKRKVKEYLEKRDARRRGEEEVPELTPEQKSWRNQMERFIAFYTSPLSTDEMKEENRVKAQELTDQMSISDDANAAKYKTYYYNNFVGAEA